MDDGFFSAAEARRVRPLPTLVPRCDQCGLFRDCGSPKMPVDGEGRRRVLVVSDYPGREEDRQGRPLVGEAGKLAAGVFRDLGFDLRRDCWITNAQICHDHLGRHPKTATDDCRPNLLRAVRDLDPEVIILMGGVALASLVGHLWKADVGKATRWAGWRIPAHKPNAWVCPTHNPAFLLRRDRDPVLRADFRRHVGDAMSLAGRPWPAGPPDYAAGVEVLHSTGEAARRLRRYRAGMVAFDYETTTLKPDGPAAEIVCASVCWEGRETIAFPWGGEVLPAMRDLLENPDVGKVGYNIKFEDRWSIAKLGTRVRGWAWDGMLAAHALDPRRGVTGLKFQAFVRLGQPDYNSHVEPFLQSVGEGCNAPNRVWEVGLPTLCKYCGVDSVLEWHVAQSQMKEMDWHG